MRPVCCCTCTTIMNKSFFDDISMADFDEVYPDGWHPGDEQVAA